MDECKGSGYTRKFSKELDPIFRTINDVGFYVFPTPLISSLSLKLT